MKTLREMTRIELIEEAIKFNINYNYVSSKELINKIKKQKSKQYCENAKIGTIVAFRIANNVFSGKIDEIHRKHFVIICINGIKYTIEKNNILWYKTGKRWPKKIYNLLKGIDKIEN